MQLKATRLGSVELYTTGLDPAEQRITGVRMTTNIDAALRDSIARHGDADVAFVPEGPYVVPVYAGA